MKTPMIIAMAALMLLLLSCYNATAQYVGSKTPPQIISITDSEKPANGFTTIKCGIFIPSAGNRLSPVSRADIKDGNISMDNGLFAEIGYGMNIGKGKAGFYFFPFLLAAYMSGYEFNTVIKQNERQFTAAEIAQRYGVFYTPVKKLFIAGYYRPAAIVPVGFNSNQFTGKLTFENGYSIKMMTHSVGLAVQYRFMSISYEYYMANPEMKVYDNSTDESYIDRIPLKLNVFSFAFNL